MIKISVLKSKRNVSNCEYIWQFQKLAKYIDGELSRIPKRKFKLLSQPIISRMNNIYNNLMQIFEQYFNYGIKLVDNSGQAEYIISELIGLQKPLISLWNIQGYETRKMVACVDLINEEITLVSRYGWLKEGSVKHAFILDRNAVQKVDFIRIMCTLHKAIYTKVISMPSTLRSMKGELLTELADEALFRICLANRFMPTNAEMVKTRKENLSLALDCLARMRPILFSIFNVMGYSERIMLDIMSTYEKEMKLLKKVMESDEKRFKDYPCGRENPRFQP